jgi:hypothetical protein
MKTAMQELIEWYKKEHFVKTTFHIQLLNKFESLLEKEKEQIIQAHKIGWEDCQEYIRTIGQTTRKGKKYYNQTYNQNK